MGLLAFGARWRLEQRARAAAEVLVAEARERTSAAERVERPSHVDEPLPGTLAEALGPLMPELIAFHNAQPTSKSAYEVRAVCTKVYSGVLPLSELPRECREDWEKGRSLMQRTLKASRAEVGGLPEGLRILDDPKHPYQLTGLMPILSVLKLAALETRFLTAQGQADAALETCLDGLALARDLSYGGALIGAMVSATGNDTLFFPCAEALDQASPGSRQRAPVALRRIRASLAPLSSAFRDERVYLPLYAAGWVLDQSQLDALPKGARAVATNMEITYSEVSDMPPLVARVLTLQAWPRLMENMDRAVAVADLPPAQRTPQLTAVDRTFTRSWNPLLRGGATDYERYAVRVDKQRAQLDLLLALALVKEQRARSGTWPTTPPPASKLRPAKGGKLLIFPEAMRPEELSVTATATP